MEQLLALGFPPAAAVHFLAQCDGDVERAANAILANPEWRPEPEAASLAEVQRLQAADEQADRLRREADEASQALARQLVAEDGRQRAGGGAALPPAYGSLRPRGQPAGGGGGAPGPSPGDLIDMYMEPESLPREPLPPPYSVDPPRPQHDSYGQQQPPQQHHGYDDAAMAVELARQDEVAALQRQLEKQERQMASERTVHSLQKDEIERKLQEEKDDKERAMVRWQRDQMKAQRAEAAAAQATADAEAATGKAN